MRKSHHVGEAPVVPERIEQHLFKQRSLRMLLAASTARLAQTAFGVAGAAPFWDAPAAPDFAAPVPDFRFRPAAKEPAPELGLLTNREIAVLKLIAEGFSSKEIAHKLGITFKTACCHRFNLMQKLGVREMATLVRIAIRCKLVEA